MTGLQMLILGAMLVAGGLVLAVRAMRPAAPSLTAALAQLSAEPATMHPVVPLGIERRPVWMPARVQTLSEGHVGARDADLKIIGWTRSQLVARKMSLALTGLLAPSVLAAMLALVGLGVFATFPVFIGLVAAGVLWWLPGQEVIDKAQTARTEFATNLEFFLTLVAGERRARGSVEQALEEAVEISDSPPFVAMRRAIREAMWSGHKPWRNLRALGEDLEIPQLRNLSDIAEVAADGAAVYGTLLAAARTLRHEELSEARTEANKASERMARPLGTLVLGMAGFVLIPFVLRAFGIG